MCVVIAFLDYNLHSSYQWMAPVIFTEAERRIDSSLTFANIVSDTGLSPGRHQAIIKTKYC